MLNIIKWSLVVYLGVGALVIAADRIEARWWARKLGHPGHPLPIHYSVGCLAIFWPIVLPMSAWEVITDKIKDARRR